MPFFAELILRMGIFDLFCEWVFLIYFAEGIFRELGTFDKFCGTYFRESEANS